MNLSVAEIRWVSISRGAAESGITIGAARRLISQQAVKTLSLPGSKLKVDLDDLIRVVNESVNPGHRD